MIAWGFKIDIMSRNSGYIYETDAGETAVALHHEQCKEFDVLKKVLVRMARNGEIVKVLKAADKLKFIGFQD